MPHIIANLLRPGPKRSEEVVRDLEEEFAHHIAESEQEFADQGMSREEARCAARERFGDIERYHRECLFILTWEFIMTRNIIIGVLSSLLVLVTIFAGILLVVSYQQQRESREIAIAARMQAEEERMAAVEQQRRAEAVTAFLTELLAHADPHSGGGEVSVSEVLDQAQQRIDSGLIESPEVEARIRETIKKARAELESGEGD